MKKLTFLFAIFILLNGCNKDDEITHKDEQENTEIKENVVAILEENSQITSSETDLENGVYSIQFSGNPPEIVTNDIIVGDQEEGFLRKVTSVSSNGNTITMQTTQANMEDVFKDAIIEFDTDLSNSSRMNNGKSEKYKINYLAKGVQFSGNGFEFDFSNIILYQEGALTFEITDGTVTFNPNFSFKGDYSHFDGLDFIAFKANNAELNIDVEVSLNASAGVSLPELSTTLADVEKKLKFLVGGVPVVVIVNTTLVAELSASIDSNFDITTGFTNNYLLSTSAKYENDNWTGGFNLSPSIAPKPINMEGEVNIAQKLTITPKVSVKFYGIIGPYCQPKMTEDFTFNIASPSLYWDSNLKVGLDVTTGVDITIFGYEVADFSRSDNFEEIVWNAPETLEIVSGNDQTGNQGEQLTEPLKVLVKDKLDNSLGNVPVYFTVTEGNGTLDNESVMTDENGFAEVFWTLGDNTDPQTVEVNVKKANGQFIESSVNFTASGDAIDNTITLSGNLDFGNVAINTTTTRILSISNEFTFAINVLSLSLPNGFTGDWSGGQIDAGFVQNVTITFAPTNLQEYSGVITVNNDTDQENNMIAVNGSGIEETELVNQIEILNSSQILNFDGLPYENESSADSYCGNYQQTFGLNYNGPNDQNWIQFDLSSSGSTLQDGTYNIVYGECSYVVILFNHTSIFSNGEQGFFANGTITISEGATVFEFSGDLYKTDAEDNDIFISQAIGRIISD